MAEKNNDAFSGEHRFGSHGRIFIFYVDRSLANAVNIARGVPRRGHHETTHCGWYWRPVGLRDPNPKATAASASVWGGPFTSSRKAYIAAAELLKSPS